MPATIRVGDATATVRMYDWTSDDALLALRIEDAMIDFNYSPGMGEPAVAAAEHVLHYLGEGELIHFELTKLPPDAEP